MILKRLICLSVFLLTLASQSLAQAPASSDEQRKARQELERKAIGLLDDVIKDSESFKHLENRIRIRVAAANLLWEHDTARARVLFREAIASLVDLLKNQEATEDPVEAAKGAEGARQLRQELAQIMAQRDPRIARELMRASGSGGRKQGPERDPAQELEQQADLNLAIQIAASDPKLAAEIGQENMTGGGTYMLPELVSAIREKDPEVAARLATDILSKLRSEKLDSSQEARTVAVGLLRLATQEPSEDDKAAGKADTPLLDQASLRELAELLASEALRSSPESAELLSLLPDLMPVIEKYAPARATALRRKMPQAEAKKEEEGEGEAEGLGKGPNEYEKYVPLLEKGSAGELVAEASKAPESVRLMLYQAAITKMIEKGELEAARQLVTEKIQDPETRKQLLEQIESALAATAAENGNIEQVRKQLATLRSKEERAMLLAQTAVGAAAKGQRKLALELLEEASGMTAQRAKNIQQLVAQLMVARGYARLDPSRSFAILEPVVDQLNELLGAATVLGGFFAEDLVRDDEIMIGPVMMFLAMSGGEIAIYMGDLSTLARADFGRTRALVDRFQRDEIRTAARLLLAQSILSSSTPEAAPKSFTPAVAIGGQ